MGAVRENQDLWSGSLFKIQIANFLKVVGLFDNHDDFWRSITSVTFWRCIFQDRWNFSIAGLFFANASYSYQKKIVVTTTTPKRSSAGLTFSWSKRLFYKDKGFSRSNFSFLPINPFTLYQKSLKKSRTLHTHTLLKYSIANSITKYNSL